MYLKQSTAHTFQLGPFLDDTDGKTAEASLTIGDTDTFLSKAGAAFAAKNDTTDLTGSGDARGYYDCVLNTTDTGTLGNLRVHVHVAGALPVWQDFVVLPANVYESLVAGSDLLDVNTAQWLGTACATPTTAGVPEVDVTHVGGTAQTAGDLAALITTADTVVDAIKVKTDQLTFTKSNEIDANVQSINGVTITGNGGTGTEFGV